MTTVQLLVVFAPRKSAFNIESGDCRKVTGIPGDSAFEFNSSGNKLAASFNSDSMHLIDVERAAIERVIGAVPHHSARVGFCFSPDDQVMAVGIVSASDILSSIRLWHFATGQNLLTLGTFGFQPGAITYSPDGRFLAAGTHADAHGNAGVIVWRFDPPRAPNRASGND